MIVSRIVGGLGNQMFEYATGYALAKRRKLEFRIDLNDFEAYKLHKYRLSEFNISAKAITREELFRYRNVWEKRSQLPRKMQKFLRPSVPTIFQEKQLSYNSELNKVKLKNLYLDGYFQSEKYFADFRDEILKEFCILSEPSSKNREILNDIQRSNSVSIHVRRGDYVTNPQATSFHGVMSVEYYRHAVKHITKNINCAKFFLFSDDLEWCRKELKIGTSFEVIENDASHNYEAIRLMSSCKHNIIANSSFSWWGAWLNQNPEKIVIAPKKWFLDKTAQQNDIVPDSWLEL